VTQPLNLQSDPLVSKFAFRLNFNHYVKDLNFVVDDAYDSIRTSAVFPEEVLNPIGLCMPLRQRNFLGRKNAVRLVTMWLTADLRKGVQWGCTS
jgi:hypothetical protein